FWNTQWGTPIGANQTTTVDDLITTADAVGTGKLLSKASHKAMTDPNLLGFGQSQPNCVPECFTQTEFYNFGLGVVRQGSWLLQTPLLSGIAASNAYLPSENIAIAVVITLLPEAFIANGGGYPPNPSKTLFNAIGAYMAPNDAPPVKTA
ncbi:MAG: D-alanyl-D-alanine carboxypeptidase, partial [Acidimicrobiales bacterium]